MNNNHKMFVAGFLACIMLLSGIAAFGASQDVDIKAILSNTVKMKLYGKDFSPREADGTYIKPLVYNGRTYLPVRTLADALNIAVDYDPQTKTIWLGGKTEIVPVNDISMYKDESRTILTTDTDKLTTSQTTYKWGVANSGPLNSVYYSCYLIPGGKYKRFTAALFLDDGASKSQTIDIRKNDKNGLALKSITLKPGDTVNVDIDISGVEKLYFFTQVGRANKLIIGEPTFRNDAPEMIQTQDNSVQ